ncbi:hypothetical protein [Methanocella conradii]|uniref:hypothetical protein n=1 Tax=Methanocella conradii TaxID=1175444 RepID=UPI0024B3C258|nr:hypothetical protein [Methanocella conradii]
MSRYGLWVLVLLLVSDWSISYGGFPVISNPLTALVPDSSALIKRGLSSPIYDDELLVPEKGDGIVRIPWPSTWLINSLVSGLIAVKV